jgi:hypothetical protein
MIARMKATGDPPEKFKPFVSTIEAQFAATA